MERLTANAGGVSWFALLVGVLLGVGGGLFYTWEIDPVIEQNTAPWQLNERAREDYIIAVALSYAHNRDLSLAFDRLRALRPNRDVWSMVADVACERHKTVQIVSNSDVLIMRALEGLYRPQGATGCADDQYPTPAAVAFITPVPSAMPTPSLTPQATKTSAPGLPPTDTLAPVVAPTSTPTTGRFILARVESYCDVALEGVIEVRVFDVAGQGMPGIPVQAVWGGNQRDTFYTGLKPGREPGYADFTMEAGRSYQVTVPGLLSDPQTFEAVPCEAEVDGETVSATASYRINFQQQAS